MIQRISVGEENYYVSKNPKDFFRCDTTMQHKCCVALDLMEDCLEYIYSLIKPFYPTAFKPELYIAESRECNAFACQGKYIIVFAGLIFQHMDIIEQKYTPELLERYKIFQGIPHEKILSGLRVYFWRYVILHELYHIWNQHSLWKKIYEFNKDGEIIQKNCALNETELTSIYAQFMENSFETEQEQNTAMTCNSVERQKRITQQAFELDADGSSIYMIINMMMNDMIARGIPEDKKNAYICTEVGLLMAALATAFSMFDGNSGAKFESLSNLENCTHPLPSIRMFFAEEIADECLSKYFPDVDERRLIEFEWQKVICDVEADFNGKIDMGQVFYYTAYTEKAQKHLCQLKHRIADMYDTLKPLALANFANKLDEEDMEFLPSFVWFTEEGKSTKQWINPATGINYAIRADKLKITTPDIY